MSKDDWIFETVDRYLIGNLSEEEKIAFESHLSVDSELQQQVEKQKAANQLLYERRLLQLRNTIKQDMQSGAADFTIRMRIFRKLWMGFGVLIFVLTPVWLFVKYQHSENSSPEKTVKQTNGNKSSNKLTISTENISQNDNSKKNIKKNDNVVRDEKTNITSPLKSDTSKIVNGIHNEQNNLHNKIILNNENTVKENNQKTFDCTDIHILIRGKPTESCQEKNDGALTLDISGGARPYKTTLYNTNSPEIITTGSVLFEHLASGTYTVLVSDVNGCAMKPHEFVIKEKHCSEENIEEYSFRPEYNEQFKFTAGKAGSISIYDRSGKEIFSSPVYPESEFIWEGIDKYGKQVEKGIYLLVVTHAEGNYKKGYITVY
jgi:hypothetical protein